MVYQYGIQFFVKIKALNNRLSMILDSAKTEMTANGARAHLLSFFKVNELFTITKDIFSPFNITYTSVNYGCKMTTETEDLWELIQIHSPIGLEDKFAHDYSHKQVENNFAAFIDELPGPSNTSNLVVNQTNAPSQPIGLEHIF